VEALKVGQFISPPDFVRASSIPATLIDAFNSTWERVDAFFDKASNGNAKAQTTTGRLTLDDCGYPSCDVKAYDEL